MYLNNLKTIILYLFIVFNIEDFEDIFILILSEIIELIKLNLRIFKRALLHIKHYKGSLKIQSYIKNEIKTMKKIKKKLVPKYSFYKNKKYIYDTSTNKF